MLRSLDLMSSFAASSLRGWRGLSLHPVVRQPKLPLELYEFEGCPYCRLVREALTELDLDAVIYPCPHGGTRFRPKAIELGGKAQFPLLVDLNTGTRLYESADIIHYLAKTYADRDARQVGLGRALAVVTSSLASAARGVRGVRARPSRAPERPLELYSFESSPFSRLVRETLTELEIPYLLRNMAKAQMADMGPPFLRERFFPNVAVEGRNRKRLHGLTGRLQVPYLVDPNRDVAMFESADIVAYLESTYGGSRER